MRVTSIVRAVLLVLVVCAGRANAELIFHRGNITTDENLQFNDGLPGGPAATIQGLTNAGTLVEINRIDVDPILLVAPSSGAARIAAINPAINPTKIALFSGAFFETPDFMFTAFEFNVQVDSNGLLTILAEDLDGVVHSSDFQLGFDGAVGNGNNRFGVTADAGMSLLNVTVQLNGKIVKDIRQVRLGGVAEIPPPPPPGNDDLPANSVNAVPEPTAIILSAISLAAFVLCAGRRVLNPRG